MNVEVSPNGSDKRLQQSRRLFMLLAMASLSLGIGVTIVEIVTWNAPPFLIGLGVIFPLIALVWWLIYRGHALRWTLFCLLMVAGIYIFLLAGLHMPDMSAATELVVDPLCYWLAAAGFALLGMGGYSAYSEELDQYFRWLVQKRKGIVEVGEN